MYQEYFFGPGYGFLLQISIHTLLRTTTTFPHLTSTFGALSIRHSRKDASERHRM